MGSFQIRITIRRPLETVFAIYTDQDTWYWWSHRHRAEWVSGKPWQAESRMRIETLDSTSDHIDQVLTRFESRSQVDFISHTSGITLYSRVTFRAVSESETEVKSQLEFVGVFSRIAGFAVGPVIERRAREFYDDLKRECEQTREEANSPAVSPDSS